MYVLTKIDTKTKAVRLYVCRSDDDMLIWDHLDNIRFDARVFSDLADVMEFKATNQDNLELKESYIVNIAYLPGLRKGGLWVDYMLRLALEGKFSSEILRNPSNIGDF